METQVSEKSIIVFISILQINIVFYVKFYGDEGKKNIVNSRKALNRSQFIDCVVGLA
jgi:hypothetical protein